MPRNRSEIVRFEVLKLLKEAPTHGYDLFLLIQDKDPDLIKQVSDLYKILRGMKKDGLIKENEEESKHGPNKKILELTSDGIDEYYDRVLEMAKAFFELLSEANAGFMRQFDEIALSELGLDSNFFENKSIFIPADDKPVFMVIRFIKNILVPFNLPMKLYLQIDSEANHRLFWSIEKSKIDLQLIDTNLRLKDESIDIILFAIPELREILIDKVKKYKKYLKKGGICLFLCRENPDRSHPRVMRGFFQGQSIFQGMPEKYKSKLAEFFPTFRNIKNGKRYEVNHSQNILNDEEFYRILKGNFKTIKKYVLEEIGFHIVLIKDPI